MNDGDADADGIPDFADGFDHYTGAADDVIASDEAGFYAMTVEVSDAVDPEAALVKFSYSASDPAALSHAGTLDEGLSYTAAPGVLRLWRKDAGEARAKEAVGECGDYIAPGKAFPLRLLLGEGKTRTVYVEGVSPGHAKVKVELDPDGEKPAVGYACSDRVWFDMVDMDFLDADGEPIEDGEPIGVVDASLLKTIAGYDAEEHGGGFILPGDYLPAYHVALTLVTALREAEADTLTATVVRAADGESVTKELSETGDDTRVFRSADGHLQIELVQGNTVPGSVDILGLLITSSDFNITSFRAVAIETGTDSLNFKSKRISLYVEFLAPIDPDEQDVIKAAVSRIGEAIPVVQALTETMPDSGVFQDAAGTLTVVITQPPDFSPNEIDVLFASVTSVGTGNEVEPTRIQETGTNSLVFEDTVFIEEGFYAKASPSTPPILPSIPDTARFRLRIVDVAQEADGFTVELRATDAEGQVIDRATINMVRQGNTGVFIAEKCILAFEGDLPDSVRTRFEIDHYVIDGERYEFTYKDVDKKKVALRVYLVGRRKAGSVPEWDETKHPLTDEALPSAAEYNSDMELYAVVRWEKDGDVGYFCGYTTDKAMPTSAKIEGQNRALQRWDQGSQGKPEFSWSMVTPDYTKTKTNNPPWADQDYVEVPQKNVTGWKYVLPRQPGVRRFAVDVGYKGGVFETPDSSARQDTTKYDYCISDKVMRIVVKGDYKAGNKEYLDWAASYRGVAWTYGSYWEHQARRYIAVDCADFAMAAYQDWAGALPGAVTATDGPSAEKIWDWARLFGEEFSTIVNPIDALRVPEAKLQPGDIILLGEDGPPGSHLGFKPIHTTIFLEHDNSGTLGAGDKCLMANSTHPGLQNQVAICRYTMAGIGSYKKAVVLRLKKKGP